VQCIGRAKSSNLRRVQSEGRSQIGVLEGQNPALRLAWQWSVVARVAAAHSFRSMVRRVELGRKPLARSVNWSASCSCE
jgi:hypothetical protein